MKARGHESRTVEMSRAHQRAALFGSGRAVSVPALSLLLCTCTSPRGEIVDPSSASPPQAPAPARSAGTQLVAPLGAMGVAKMVKDLGDTVTVSVTLLGWSGYTLPKALVAR